MEVIVSDALYFPYFGAHLRQLVLSQTPANTVRPRIPASGVPVYSPAIAGTHRAYPRRGGQAGWLHLHRVDLPALRPSVAHPGTNRARRGSTWLVMTGALPLS